MRGKEFWAGVVFLAIGASAVVGATQYSIGTATQMGPGYFPMLLGLLLMALGAAAIVQAARKARAEPVGKWPLVPLAFVVAGVLCFAALIEDAGLVPALLALVVLSCYGRWRKSPVEVAAICVAVCVLSVAIFIYGLQLPLVAW